MMQSSEGRTKVEFLVSIFVLVLVALAPLVVGNVYWLGVLIVCMYFAMQSVGWNLLAGYTGQMSLAPAAFAMVGAYGTGLMSYHLGAPPWIGIPVGVVTAFFIGVLLGWVVLRLSGAYLALTTLAFAEILRLAIGNSYGFTRGDLGLNVPGIFESRLSYYYLMLGALTFVQVGVYLLLRSKYGLYLQAIRDDEIAASSRGVDVVHWKTLAFAISAAICGLAGALYAHFAQLVSPELGLILQTGFVLSMVVIGGIGTMSGPIIGAFLVYIVSEALRDAGGYHLIVFSLAVIIIARFFREGLWGLIKLPFSREKLKQAKA
ncbi:branched-chain amino acid ABC transporter permease [Pikeienuella sp. HZG-20]|uniref:branched-chain amino acid ABC transporter permease n=1 Tax=Paludibacillus litoralis TaxID=3133267 RepID=UPI0030EC6458